MTCRSVQSLKNTTAHSGETRELAARVPAASGTRRYSQAAAALGGSVEGWKRSVAACPLRRKRVAELLLQNPPLC